MVKLSSLILRVTLVLFCTMLFISCKKEAPSQLHEESILKSKPQDAFKSLSYDKFIKDYGVEKLQSVVKQSLYNSKSSTGVLIADGEQNIDLEFETDSVKVIKHGDTTSYIIAIKLANSRDVTFRNLTIEVSKDRETAFITSMTPTQNWIKSWREGHPIAWEGDVKVFPFKSAVTKGKRASIANVSYDVICEDYVIYSLVPHQCSEGDWPGQCAWEKDPNFQPSYAQKLPYYTVQTTYVEACYSVPTGSEGTYGTGSGGGSGGGTSPNPPPGYNPCGTTPPPGVASKNTKSNSFFSAPPPSECQNNPPSAAMQLADNLGIVNLSHRNFLQSSATLVQDVNYYLGLNNSSEDAKAIAKWSIEYIYAYDDVSFETLSKNFTFTDEGSDEGEYDENYWNNLALAVVPLPTAAQMLAHYPHKVTNGKRAKMMNTEVYALVGGDLYQKHLTDNKYKNGCALRTSIGLNGIAGHDIPAGTGVHSQGGKNFILGAKAMNTYLRKKYGAATVSSETNSTLLDSYTNITNKIKGKTAIYSIVYKNDDNLTGHVDLIVKGEVIGELNIPLKKDQQTPNKSKIERIDIWILN